MLAGFTRRQKTFAVTSAGGVVLAGVILVLINVLFNWAYVRWDMTRNKTYSLSAASKRLVRSLEDPIVIKAYFSTDLPAPYNTYSRYVKDVLAEYRGASRGRVRYEFVPTNPPGAFEDKAMAAGMAPLQFEQMGSDQLQIRRGFMGLVILYRDRTEALPIVKNPDHLEYDLTSRIAQMTRKQKKKIASLIGHGEANWRSSPIKLAQDLPAFYDMDRLVSLPQATTGPIQTDALLVVGPQVPYDETSLWVIDQTLMSGVPIAFLIDTKRFIKGRFEMQPLTTGLEALLQSYGLQLSERLVYDAQCETLGMTQNISGMAFTTSLRYPYVPQVTAFDKKHPILSGVESVSLAFVSSLQTATLPKSVTFTPLLYSSAKSWLAPSTLYSVAPNTIIRPQPGDPHGPYVLAGLLEGSFPSHFAGKASPVKGAPFIAQSPKTSIFILPSSHALDPDLPEFSGTNALITNAMAYLTHDETLIGIQSKGDILRPLKPLSSPFRKFIILGCVLGVPLLPALIGIARWRRRETWRKSIHAQFNPPHAPAATA